MSMRGGWKVYDDDLRPDVHEFEVHDEQALRELLTKIASVDAEEVLLCPIDADGNDLDRSMMFQLNDDKSLAYVRYGQGGDPTYESIGDVSSPEVFTSSGGSFSGGTGVTVDKLIPAAIEFFRTHQRPTSIEWSDEEQTYQRVHKQPPTNLEIPF